MHRVLNSCWPVKCGTKLAYAIKCCFQFNWNFKRAVTTKKVDGWNPGCIRLSNIDDLSIIEVPDDNTQLFTRAYWEDRVANRSSGKDFQHTLKRKRKLGDKANQKAIHRNKIDQREAHDKATKNQKVADDKQLQRSIAKLVYQAQHLVHEVSALNDESRCRKKQKVAVETELPASNWKGKNTEMRILWNLFHGENKENFVNADNGMRNWDKALTEFISQCNSHNISDYDIYDRNRPAAIEKLKGFYFKVVTKYVPPVDDVVTNGAVSVTTDSDAMIISNDNGPDEPDEHDAEPIVAPSTTATSSESINRPAVALENAPRNGRGEVGLTLKEIDILKGAIAYAKRCDRDRKTYDWGKIQAEYLVQCRKLVNDTNYKRASKDNKVYRRDKDFLKVFHRDNKEKFE